MWRNQLSDQDLSNYRVKTKTPPFRVEPGKNSQLPCLKKQKQSVSNLSGFVTIQFTTEAQSTQSTQRSFVKISYANNDKQNPGALAYAICLALNKYKLSVCSVPPW